MLQLPAERDAQGFAAVETAPDLAEGEPDAAKRYHLGEVDHVGLRVAAMASGTAHRRQGPDLVVMVECSHRHAGLLRQLTDRPVLRHACHRKRSRRVRCKRFSDHSSRRVGDVIALKAQRGAGGFIGASLGCGRDGNDDTTNAPPRLWCSAVRRAIFLMGVIMAGVVASLRALVRRALRGPTLPSWTWSEELLVAVSRASLTASARDVGLMTPRGGGLRPPLGWAARRVLTVETLDLNGVPTERFQPKTSALGTILYFHGGGFVTGSAALERRQAAAQAMASRCDTFSIDYRLAPAHPFPAALDDAVVSYTAVLERGADPATTVLFGGSAGACLALSSLLKVRELGLPQPAGAVLLWPYADFTFSGHTINTNGDVDMLPVRDLAHVWGPAYVGNADPSDPLVSPALADLTGLAPLLIIAGGAESLLSCAEQIAANARRVGVDTQLSVYPEKVHGWMMLPKLPATVSAIAEINAWISTRIGRT